MKEFLLSDLLNALRDRHDAKNDAACFPGLWTPALASYFQQNVLPTRKSSGWQHVSLRTLLASRYLLADYGQPEIPAQVRDASREKYALVLMDGCVVPSLCRLPNGVQMSERSLHVATKQGAWKTWLQALQSSELFSRLALVLAKNTLELTVDATVGSEGSLHVYHYVTKKDAHVMAVNIRAVLAPHAVFNLIEHPVVNLAQGQSLLLSNVVCELSAGARLRHDNLQWAEKLLDVLSHTSVCCAQDSSYHVGFVGASQSLLRWFCGVDLQGPGAQASLRGVSLPSQVGQLDIQGVVRHTAAHTQSSQQVKAAVADAGSGGFCGRVYVAQDAQNIDSSQVHHNLLLSPKAKVFSKPELEIYADDVKCAHGSTVGCLDESQLFYLQSRGLSIVQAKKLLVQGFVRSVFADDTAGDLAGERQRIIEGFLSTLS